MIAYVISGLEAGGRADGMLIQRTEGIIAYVVISGLEAGRWNSERMLVPGTRDITVCVMVSGLEAGGGTPRACLYRERGA